MTLLHDVIDLLNKEEIEINLLFEVR